MLTAHIERYVALRQALGFRLRDTARRLRAFARFATARSDTHIRTSTAVDWTVEAPSPGARYVRLRDVVHLARFLHAEELLLAHIPGEQARKIPVGPRVGG